MLFVKRIDRLKKIITREKKRGKVVGFVPTMGYLHEGHLSLVRIARRKSHFLVVSIFVNPTQFAPHEDLKRYPRNLKNDMKLLRDEEVDLIFCPNTRQMYPPHYATYVEVQGLTRALCGVSRPHHFRGVTTIVLKLLNIVQPDIAIFGKKDYQQAVIIQRMVKDLDLDVRIALGPTVREKDGLATSSRNIYLSKRERSNAKVLYESLQWIRQAYKKGLRTKTVGLAKVRALIRQRGGKIDYVEAVDKRTLKSVHRLNKGTLIALAVYFGKTRLIDNIIL